MKSTARTGTAALAIILLCLAGCANLMEPRDPPVVSLENLRALPASGMGPRFEVTLRIANPNAESLEIVGISYSLALLDREVFSGVTDQVPNIGPYREETVKLEAGLRLLEVLRLLAELGRAQDEAIDYRLAAKIDFRGLLPTQRVEERGELRLPR